MCENQILNAGLWFFIGVLSHKTGSWIFLNSYAFLFLEEAIANTLKILKYANDNTIAATKVSYEIYSKIKTEEELKEIKEKDETFLNLWRLHSVRTLLSHCTPGMRNKLSFSNWFQAMNYLDKREKKKL